ncbi:MAG: radical SAM protein [Pseudomonadota bacterium]
MKDLRILFINPCLRHGAKLKILPVGLGSVMTYVRQCGYDFELYDIDINEPDDAQVESFLTENQFDVILYGSIVTHYAWMKWLTHTIKRHHPETITIIGNSVAASCAKVFMDNTPADVIVHGEGEMTCVDVLHALRSGATLDGIEGITFRQRGGKIVKNPPRKAGDINLLPMPDWSLFDVPAYFSHSVGTSFGSDKADAVTMPVSTARGCAFRCSFCHFVFWDDPYRHRKPDLVLAEIRRDMELFGANYFNFWDDLSFASVRQVERMLDAIEESKLEFEWSAAIRTDLLGREKLPTQKRIDIAKRMRDLGCNAVGYSLESANAEILKMMNKHVERDFFLEQVEILREAGITSNVSVVFGYPIETKDTIKETFDMCLQAQIYPSIGYLLPLPATKMYDYALENGFIVDEDEYLVSITERQDLCVNMTTMGDTEVLETIAEGASRLNEQLNIGLSESSLIKTGGYRKHTNKKTQLGDSMPKRNENDFSFNYSNAEFDMSNGTAS